MENKIQIIGCSGKAGSGKDLVGKIIQYLTSIPPCIEVKERVFNPNTIAGFYNSEWQIKKFATKVKEVCSLLTGIPVEDFEKEEVKSSILGEEWRYYEDGVKQYYTVRSLLQKVGTDAMRDVIHPDVWVNALMKDYRPLDIYNKQDDYVLAINPVEHPNWLVTDVRFPNECKAIKDRHNSLLIRVERPNFVINTNTNIQHISEIALDNYLFDEIIINEGSIKDLINKVKFILDKRGLI